MNVYVVEHVYYKKSFLIRARNVRKAKSAAIDTLAKDGIHVNPYELEVYRVEDYSFEVCVLECT
ncbi:MAG: hypothetical protein J6K63_00035 [Clostridia bacterium]|nr:hypothetical protein [Clostridia bacterium]